MLGQLNVTLQDLIESGDWTNEDDLEVKIGTGPSGEKVIIIHNNSQTERLKQ